VCRKIGRQHEKLINNAEVTDFVNPEKQGHRIAATVLLAFSAVGSASTHRTFCRVNGHSPITHNAGLAYVGTARSSRAFPGWDESIVIVLGVLDRC